MPLAVADKWCEAVECTNYTTTAAARYWSPMTSGHDQDTASMTAGHRTTISTPQSGPTLRPSAVRMAERSGTVQPWLDGSPTGLRPALMLMQGSTAVRRTILFGLGQKIDLPGQATGGVPHQHPAHCNASGQSELHQVPPAWRHADLRRIQRVLTSRLANVAGHIRRERRRHGEIGLWERDPPLTGTTPRSRMDGSWRRSLAVAGNITRRVRPIVVLDIRPWMRPVRAANQVRPDREGREHLRLLHRRHLRRRTSAWVLTSATATPTTTSSGASSQFPAQYLRHGRRQDGGISSPVVWSGDR